MLIVCYTNYAGTSLIGVIVGSVVGGIVLFVCCPIVIIVSIVCWVFCCIVGQSNCQAKSKTSRAGPPDATQKVPLTTSPEAPVPTELYPLQPAASAPPLDAPSPDIGADLAEYPADPDDQQYPPPSAPYPTNPPPPYPGTSGTHPIETVNLKEPLQ